MEQIAKGCDNFVASPDRLIDFVGRPWLTTLRPVPRIMVDHLDDDRDVAKCLGSTGNGCGLGLKPC